MIHGVGLDLVHIPRILTWVRTPRLLERFFHPRELEEARRRGDFSGAALGTRFAAKEALGKALGWGLRGLVLKEIEVRKDPGGRPVLELHGRTGDLVRAAGIRALHLSLSHEHDTAAAMVVLEA